MTGKHTMGTRSGEPGGMTDLPADASNNIGAALKSLLGDVFTLYLKTKKSHWHMSGPHFIDCHLLLDEHGMQIFTMIDPIAEIKGQFGGTTLRSIENNACTQSAADSDEKYVAPKNMLAELRDESPRLAKTMREVRKSGDGSAKAATTSLFEVWIDETECRARFRYKASRHSSIE